MAIHQIVAEIFNFRIKLWTDKPTETKDYISAPKPKALPEMARSKKNKKKGFQVSWLAGKLHG